MELHFLCTEPSIEFKRYKSAANGSAVPTSFEMPSFSDPNRSLTLLHIWRLFILVWFVTNEVQMCVLSIKYLYVPYIDTRYYHIFLQSKYKNQDCFWWGSIDGNDNETTKSSENGFNTSKWCIQWTFYSLGVAEFRSKNVNKILHDNWLINRFVRGYSCLGMPACKVPNLETWVDASLFANKRQNASNQRHYN